MKKVLALILSVALVLSVVILPTATFVSAETESLSALSFSDAITVLSEDLNPRAIRTKELSDGTVAAVYYRSGKGVYYATSPDGGITFENEVKLIGNATDSELAAAEESTTQTALAKQYVNTYGQYGRGRLEAQNPNLIELDNGNVAAFYRYNTFTSAPDTKPWSVYYASICYQILDKETGIWGDVQVMVDAYNNKEITSADSDYGFWEPDPVYIGDELFCYYADTYTPNNLSQQHIMYCVFDEDTGKFGAPAIAQNGTEHASRDGMSVVTKLSDGTYAMVFESTKTNKENTEDYITFVIKMSFSKDGRNWTDPVIVAKPDIEIRDCAINDVTKTEYAVCASPYIAVLPDGRLAISYQTTDRFTGRTPNRVSYRVGTQVAISSEVITYDTFAQNTINDDVTSYFATELNPGIIGENEFSKSAQLMVKDNKLMVYYGIGSNEWTDDTVKNNFGAINMAYIMLPESGLDGSKLENYIVYNNSGKTVTAENGVFTLPNGCTNMIYGESDKVDVFERGTAVEGLLDINNYTTYTNSALADRIVIDTENESISFDSQTRNWLAGTDDMTAFEASATIEGNSKGSIYAGFGFHMQKDAFATTTFKYSTSGYTVIVKRSTTSANVEILVRYISGTTVYDETINKITATGLVGTTTEEKVNLKVWADNKNFYVAATNGDGTKSTGTYTYPLDYTSANGKIINWQSGGFMLTANGVNTITNFELYNGNVKTVDSSKMINAADLDATATINFPETLSKENQVGMSFRVQSAVDKPAPGVSGYVVKLLQTTEGNNSLKIQMTRYGTKTDGTTNSNLGNMYTYTDTTVLGEGSIVGASIILDAKLRDNNLTLTLTNADNNILTSTYEFDLKKASGSYSDYYEYGGFGFFKNGDTTDITVSDVSFTKIAKNVNNIADDSVYTIYRPKVSEDVVFADNAFVNNDATSKKIMLNNALVSDFTADTTLEVGADGNLKGGIIFRAQNVGGEANAMDGYSAVVYKTPNNTANYGRIVLLVYKWARLADGTMDYMGAVGSKVYLDTFNSVYPEAESNLLAAVGAKVKLNIEVEGDKVTANFDVLNKDNIIAASSAKLEVNLNNAPTGVDKNKVFADDATSIVYNAGEVGLSISTLGKICDFNIDYDNYYSDICDISNLEQYSSTSKTITVDTVNNKFYSTTTGFKRAVDWSSDIENFKFTSTAKSSGAGTLKVGFDFGLNRDEFDTTKVAGSTSPTSTGYRVYLKRDTGATAQLYLFKYTIVDGEYKESRKLVSDTTFFENYSSYGEIDVLFEVTVENGNLIACATVKDYPEKTISITETDINSAGSYGFFIEGGGAINYPEVRYSLDDALVTVADTEKGSVYTTVNSGAALVGDTVKVVPVENKGYPLDKVVVAVGDNETVIEETEDGYVFTKEYGATEVSAIFKDYKFGDIVNDGKHDGLDLAALRKVILEVENDYEFCYTDCNNDDVVDIRDIVNLKKIVAEIE